MGGDRFVAFFAKICGKEGSESGLCGGGGRGSGRLGGLVFFLFFCFFSFFGGRGGRGGGGLFSFGSWFLLLEFCVAKGASYIYKGAVSVEEGGDCCFDPIIFSEKTKLIKK